MTQPPAATCSICSAPLVWAYVRDTHKLVCPRAGCPGHNPHRP